MKKKPRKPAKPATKQATSSKQKTTSSNKRTAKVDWSRLTHAYGKASDLPAKLAALSSRSAKEREQAIFMIGASICHQGTLYTATAPAVVELVALAARTSTPDRGAILRLLADILTLDDHGALILDGLDSKRLPALPASFKKSLAAARAGFEVYVELLRAPEADVRSTAAFALAWIDQRAEAAVPHLRAALDAERDPSARASLAIAFAFVARAAGATDTAVLDEVGRARELITRVGAVLAKAHVSRGQLSLEETATLAEAARTRDLVTTELPWLGGNLALFALRVLSALPRTAAIDDALLAVVEGTGGSPGFAANVLARRILGPEIPSRKEKAAPRDRSTPLRHDREEDRLLASLPVKLASLDGIQRRFLAALASNPAAIDGHLTEALAARGYPSTASLVRRFLGETGPQLSVLDRPLAAPLPATVEAALVAGARAPVEERPARAKELVDAIGGEAAFEAALTAAVDLDLDQLNYFLSDLAWAAGPTAPVAAAAAQRRLEVEGEPKRTVGDSNYSYPFVYVLVGIAQAAHVLAHGGEAPPHLDAYLQKSYGFWARTRDALAALPVERREAWVLHKARDTEAQPAQFFKGAWPYWTAVPTKKIVDRALAHVKTWSAKDKWGGQCSTYALPLLVELRDAVRAAGDDVRRIDAALDHLRARKPAAAARRAKK